MEPRQKLLYMVLGRSWPTVQHQQSIRLLLSNMDLLSLSNVQELIPHQQAQQNEWAIHKNVTHCCCSTDYIVKPLLPDVPNSSSLFMTK